MEKNLTEKVLEQKLLGEVTKPKNLNRITKFIKDSNEAYSYANLKFNDIEEVRYMIDNIYMDADKMRDLLTNNLFTNTGVINITIKPTNDGPVYDISKNNILFMVEGDLLLITVRDVRRVLVVDINTHKSYVVNIGKNLPTIDDIIGFSAGYQIIVYQTIGLFTEMINTNKELVNKDKRIIGKDKKNRIKYSTNYSISLNNIKKYTYNENYTPSKKYKRHTESWNVRGFWRTYKSGKRIWIKPSTRGNKKVKPKNQTYTM